jgi:hypothetical protein
MIRIYDEGTHVLIENTLTDKPSTFPKNNYQVYIDRIDADHIIISQGGAIQFDLFHSEVSVPSLATPQELVLVLTDYLNEAGAGPGGGEVTILVDGFPVDDANPLPVSFTASAGAATEAKQDDQIAIESSIDARLSSANVLLSAIETDTTHIVANQATAAAQEAQRVLLAAIEADTTSIDGKTPALVGGRVPVTNPDSLPLPSGAATEASQAAQSVILADIQTAAEATAADKATATLQEAIRLLLVEIETAAEAINAKTPSLANNAAPSRAIALSVTDTITSLNDEAVLTVDGYSGCAIDLRGTFTATVTFQGTIDGTNFFNLVATPVASAANVATVNTATAAGGWYVNCMGCIQVRARATAFTSGTITATLRAVANPAWIYQAPIGTTNAISGTVTAGVSAGTNAIGDVGTQLRANATGAASIRHVISAATTNATVVKASAGRVAGWNISNTNAAFRYVKFHNQTTTPTAGSGVVATVAIPPNSNVHFELPAGIGFSSGIGITTVTGAADNDTNAVGLNDLIIDIYYA